MNMEHSHKGWPFAILGTMGTFGAWIVDHGFGLLLGIASLVSIIIAIKASMSAKRASDAEAALAQRKTNFLICTDCMRDELTVPPSDCPHPVGPFPRGCMKSNPFFGQRDAEPN